MSPEQLETRFAELRQKVYDLAERVAEQFRELDADIRAIAPIVREVDRLRDGQMRNNEKLAEMANKVDAIHTRLDKRDQSEESDRKEREKEKRASSRQLWLILAGVLASSVGGLLIQLLHVGTN